MSVTQKNIMKYLKKDFYKKISFDNDIFKNKNILSNEICGQNILVIGGAGTIGSNYIKQILKFIHTINHQE